MEEYGQFEETIRILRLQLQTFLPIPWGYLLSESDCILCMHVRTCAHTSSLRGAALINTLLESAWPEFEMKNSMSQAPRLKEQVVVGMEVGGGTSTLMPMHCVLQLSSDALLNWKFSSRETRH